MRELAKGNDTVLCRCMRKMTVDSYLMAVVSQHEQSKRLGAGQMSALLPRASENHG